MATLVSIKQRIDQLGSGEFQILCDAYLSRKGYQNIVSLGTKAGSHKTTKGTPDTYFYTDDGKYVFVEYTTQKDDLVGKIRGDINKCLDEDNTGIALSSISEIVYCHTSSNLSPRSSASLRKLCKDHGILLTLIGIDALADDLQNFPAIVKKHLQLEIDTEQILSIEDFISAYNSNALAASLNTQFAFREEELKKIDEAFETKDVVILSGTAGTGKTRLALEYARSRIAKNHDTTFFVRNHSLPIFDDLKFYFDTPRHYFLVIDDANQLSELKLVVELANKKQDGYYFKILITVRNYALQIVRERISEIARYKEIQINALTDNEIESIVKNTYGIVNPKYLERIARISEGNARIAILCGKIAVETDRLDSISDVSQLYEEYYGPVFFTAGLDATVPLQISAAVIAFLGSIHFDHIEPVLPLLMKKGIDVDSFIREVYKLHELEIVDIYHDKACSISDQCFSNYILKRVFFDQKSLGLSEMIEACFEPFRERTIQSINTLIGVFCGDSLRAFVSDEIKAAWKGHQSKTDSKYTGNVWTHIISLKREDAERLGYDNAKAWRDLLRAHRNEIAAAMHIPPNDFRWYAAFHNEGHHPHVHMMAWSVKPGQAHLNRDGIRQIRSQLTNDVFKHEMLQLYEQKSASRDALVREARHALMELADRMRNTLTNGPAIENRMQELVQALDGVDGKHQYGYLKKPVKRQVDEIVDALEGFPIVRECYERWLELQDQVDSYYKDERRARLPLSEQKEFRAIKNAVIQVADQMGTLTFEDERMRDEPDAFADGWYEFHDLYAAILDENSSIEDRDENAERLRAYAEDGDACAQYYLGALYRDGGVLIPDDEQAEKWFRLSAAQGNDCAAYALAKLLQEQGLRTEAVKWMEQSAQAENRFAQYQLAKLHLTGDGVAKDVGKALELLEASASQGNPFAAYLLGKLYLDGQLVKQDVTRGMAYMEQAGAQGTPYAKFFINRQDSLKPTALMLSVTRLLHHMGGVFRDNSLPQSGAPLMRIDRKRFAELARRKGYQTARNYAREMQEENEHNGQTMSAPW